MPYTNALSTGTPQQKAMYISTSAFADDENLMVLHYISYANGAFVKANVQVYQDTSPVDLYTKQRVVSSGLRIFKTSASDTESGILNMCYSRDGAAMDEHATFSDLLNRRTDENAKIYLAGKFGTLRNQVGFVSQVNYRPYNIDSFKYRDSVRDREHALFGSDVPAPLWLVNTTTGKLISMYDI